MQRRIIGAAMLSCLATTAAEAQQPRRVFVGVVTGVSTLSADARSEVTMDGEAVSLYKPENGPALNVFVGLHVRDYVTVQANYIGNRNELALTSLRATAQGSLFYEQPLTSSQHAVVGDLLLYFRERQSIVRPYLSFGAGAVRVQTTPNGPARGRHAVPPVETARSAHAVLRVAVGLDVTLGSGWSARYSFSESLSDNPLSAQLSPAGQRNLANFQNLLGVVFAP